MSESGEHEVTQLIASWRAGDTDAREALMSLVYANVRTIAGQSLRQMPGATLSATDLAHEALIRMLGSEAPWRKRMSHKRGSGADHVDLDVALNLGPQQSDSTLMRLDGALNELADNHARRAQMIELVYFGGLNRIEVAATLDVSEGTVDRDLRLARAWLRTALEA